MNRRYYNSINLLRIGFSVFIACIAHYMIILCGDAFTGTVSDEILRIIYVGVEVFFAISGFFAYMSYYDRISTKNLGFVQFICGRIKRLYPTMIISVVMIAAAQWISYYLYGYVAILDYDDGRNTIRAFVLSLLGVNCGWISDHDSLSINGVTWYISILMICYIIFFLYAVIAGGKRIREYILALIMMLIGVIILIISPDLPLMYISNGRGYLDFFGGVLIAVLTKHIGENYRRILIGVGAVLLIIYALLRIMVSPDLLCYLCAFFFCPGVIILFVNVWWLERLSDNRLMRYSGKISYAIYLFNMPVLAWIVLLVHMSGITIDYSSIYVWILCAGANILFAMAMQLLVDKVGLLITKRRER